MGRPLAFVAFGVEIVLLACCTEGGQIPSELCRGVRASEGPSVTIQTQYEQQAMLVGCLRVFCNRTRAIVET